MPDSLLLSSRFQKSYLTRFHQSFDSIHAKHVHIGMQIEFRIPYFSPEENKKSLPFSRLTFSSFYLFLR
jgi:hypothetical protein